MDSCPTKLALGTTTWPRSAYERNVPQLIHNMQAYSVPLLISFAGGNGRDAHVKEPQDIKIVTEMM